MAYTATHQTATRGNTGRFAATMNSLRVRLAQYRVYRRTLNELERLSDRDLADLGISRSMITTVSADAAYGNN
ncbi:DUF1127 domain-containing protein [Oceaniglobus indicus]|uniref:DUF1127 domain-containing protein n=1 Tax=Oceaniglobus indicus TaxID=2047749 RepID=UPI000C185634|nr:DUF1127 domain-containing protein [Oceaniglobus indicus]